MHYRRRRFSELGKTKEATASAQKTIDILKDKRRRVRVITHSRSCARSEDESSAFNGHLAHVRAPAVLWQRCDDRSNCAP